ncbi:MAG: plastocyanin/azurin family copper-binding protein [Dehalococcoidia bacterium]
MPKTTTALLLLAMSVAFLALRAPSAYAGGGCHATGLSDGDASEVFLTQNCFEPAVARVQPGDTVTWVSHDATAHTVTGSRDTFGGYDELFDGDTYSRVFDVEGVFPYFCQLHPGMVGAIVVGDGVPDGAPVAAAEPAPDDDGGSSTMSVAAIAAAVGAGGAALGLVGTRLRTGRKPDGES